MKACGNSQNTVNSDKQIDISMCSADHQVNKTTSDGAECSISNSNFSNQNNHGSNLSDIEHLGPNKVNLVGGHINQINIESDEVIKKKTSLQEAIQYKYIFDDSESAQGLLAKTK